MIRFETELVYIERGIQSRASGKEATKLVRKDGYAHFELGDHVGIEVHALGRYGETLLTPEFYYSAEALSFRF